MTIRELKERGLSLSRLAEQSPRGTLSRRDSAGGETLPDRAWNQRDEPNLWDELTEANK